MYPEVLAHEVHPLAQVLVVPGCQQARQAPAQVQVVLGGQVCDAGPQAVQEGRTPLEGCAEGDHLAAPGDEEGGHVRREGQLLRHLQHGVAAGVGHGQAGQELREQGGVRARSGHEALRRHLLGVRVLQQARQQPHARRAVVAQVAQAPGEVGCGGARALAPEGAAAEVVQQLSRGTTQGRPRGVVLHRARQLAAELGRGGVVLHRALQDRRHAPHVQEQQHLGVAGEGVGDHLELQRRVGDAEVRGEGLHLREVLGREG
uniref:Uncharacterized protein n=1 Tax=Spironucleus salmonicida TaxID=348837 RepID=V6LVX3_9EUKA|eukprot:EST47856.1 Hypothetical protein SS50377_12047 [Spironucleus salmonicida]